MSNTPSGEPALIYLGIPFFQTIYGQCFDAWEEGLDPERPEQRYLRDMAGGAFHCRNFNQLWCSALNTRKKMSWDYFAMVHHDVRPEGYWLTQMVDLLRQHKADLLSVVLPIKSAHGLTSTGVRNRKSGEVRRLTMHEVTALPVDTFDAEGAGFPGHDLLASTGLWICDFTKPWVETMWFEVCDRIKLCDDGLYRTETTSEDWAFSHQLHKMGLKIMATKAIKAGHWGPHEFRNDWAWGGWKTDQVSDRVSMLDDVRQWPIPGVKR